MANTCTNSICFFLYHLFYSIKHLSAKYLINSPKTNKDGNPSPPVSRGKFSPQTWGLSPQQTFDACQGWDFPCLPQIPCHGIWGKHGKFQPPCMPVCANHGRQFCEVIVWSQYAAIYSAITNFFSGHFSRRYGEKFSKNVGRKKCLTLFGSHCHLSDLQWII